ERGLGEELASEHRARRSDGFADSGLLGALQRAGRGQIHEVDARDEEHERRDDAEGVEVGSVRRRHELCRATRIQMDARERLQTELHVSTIFRELLPEVHHGQIRDLRLEIGRRRARPQEDVGVHPEICPIPGAGRPKSFECPHDTSMPNRMCDCAGGSATTPVIVKSSESFSVIVSPRIDAESKYFCAIDSVTTAVMGSRRAVRASPCVSGNVNTSKKEESANRIWSPKKCRPSCVTFRKSQDNGYSRTARSTYGQSCARTVETRRTP